MCIDETTICTNRCNLSVDSQSQFVNDGSDLYSCLPNRPTTLYCPSLYYLTLYFPPTPRILPLRCTPLYRYTLHSELYNDRGDALVYRTLRTSHHRFKVAYDERKV
jgi:hypothetical protein